MEKSSAKTLARIKRLLQAYAFARPYLRLTLKVLKSKDRKADWKYPLNTGVRRSESECRPFAAIIDILGKKLIDQCQWTCLAWSSTGELVEKATQALEVNPDREPSYRFEAALAKPGCGMLFITEVYTARGLTNYRSTRLLCH